MGILIPRQQIDRRNSENWAIALVGTGGAIIAFAIFDLVNLTTRRGHLMWLVAGGLSAGVTTTGPLTAFSYARFRTPRPLNHGDFDLAGGRLTTAGVGLGAGYSMNYLTIWVTTQVGSFWKNTLDTEAWLIVAAIAAPKYLQRWPFFSGFCWLDPLHVVCRWISESTRST